MLDTMDGWKQGLIDGWVGFFGAAGSLMKEQPANNQQTTPAV